MSAPAKAQNRYGAGADAGKDIGYEVYSLRRDLTTTNTRVSRLEGELQSLRGAAGSRGGQISFDRGNPAPVNFNASADGAIHRVERGETLSSIARRYRVGVDRIVAANRITNPNALRVGQEIIIPGRKGSEAVPTPPPPGGGQTPAVGSEYSVRAGDTLSSIARRHGVTATSIIQANRLHNPNALRIGQVLHIPGGSAPAPRPDHGSGSGSRPPAPPPKDSGRPQRNGEVFAPEGHGFYQIEPGDTLHSIAISFGTNTAELRRLNGLSRGAPLHVGDYLLVPVPDESLYEG